MPHAPDPSLLHSHHLDRVILEFTTRCNLRCTYCAVTRPWNAKRDLDLSDFPALVAEMKELGVHIVQISGAGETTILKGWDEYLTQLLDAGFSVSIISNLAKSLNERNVRALSRCSEITMSCDTVKPEVVSAIRVGSDLPTFLHNILRIRARCLAEQRPVPRLIWNCVANDQVIFDVEEWVAVGVAVGVDHFQLSELTRFPDLPEALNVNGVGSLSTAGLERANRAVGAARRVAESAGRAFTVVPALEEVLAGNRQVLHVVPKLAEEAGKPVVVGRDRFVQIHSDDGSSRRAPEPPAATEELPAGKTRNCVLPWTDAFVWATNQITPCCMYKEAGRIGEDIQLKDVLNSPGFVEIRRGLLSGRLSPTCQLCTMFDRVDPEVLASRVEALQKNRPGPLCE